MCVKNTTKLRQYSTCENNTYTKYPADPITPPYVRYNSTQAERRYGVHMTRRYSGSITHNTTPSQNRRPVYWSAGLSAQQKTLTPRFVRSALLINIAALYEYDLAVLRLRSTLSAWPMVQPLPFQRRKAFTFQRDQGETKGLLQTVGSAEGGRHSKLQSTQ